MSGTFREEHFVLSGKDTASLEEKKKEKKAMNVTESKAESVIKFFTGFRFKKAGVSSWVIACLQGIRTSTRTFSRSLLFSFY